MHGMEGFYFLNLARSSKGMNTLFVKKGANTLMMNKTLSRRMLISAFALLCLLLACIMTFKASAAYAAPVHLSCAGTESLSFTPGVTTTIQPTDETRYDTYAGCLSLSNPTVTGGHGSAWIPQVETTCNTLGTVPAFYQNFYWNDVANSYSQVYFSSTTDVKMNGTEVITSTGSVTGGLGKGSNVVQTTTLANLNLLACSTPNGLTSISGAVLLVFS